MAGGRLRVAVFGGSFNPPHVAHLFAAVYALATAPVDRVLVIPVFQHPFAKALAPFADRLAMCELALGWVPGVEISTVEQELGGESRTLRTVEHLAAQHPDWALRLLIGADVLPDLPKWHRFDRIAEIAPPLVMGRRGAVGGPGGEAERQPSAVHAHALHHALEHAPPRQVHPHVEPTAAPLPIPAVPPPILPQVSSTEIRGALAAGDLDAVRDRVPAAVLAYIVARGLYADPGP